MHFEYHMKTKHYLIVFLLCIFSANVTFAMTHTNSEETPLKIQQETPTLIELLQDGESYSIEITSIGCFNGTRQTVVVSKETGVFTAHFQDKETVLNENDIDAFITFELQLRALKLGGCTTVDTYVLRYGGDKFQTSDGTCSWNGGRKLLEQLGLA